MEKDSNVTPMRPLRDVLAEFEAMIDSDQAVTSEGICVKCNNTGTEVIYQDGITSARPCSH